MAIANDGTVRIAGVLSNGDGSCVGRDNFTRVDTYRDFIEGYTGPTVVQGAACGETTRVGRCMDGRALWCQDDELVSESCESCGWDEAEQGFRCISGPDPCDGVDNFGVCEAGVARWCEQGEVKSRDCGACGEQCGIVEEVDGVYCAPDPCMGLDYYGRCEGDVAQYCKEGEYRERNCGAEGLSCGWVNDDLGYWCY